ncbi:MAG: transaldolase family protein [Candidatus Babeliales bacterium]|nr:transaldolase family protein [Candidatus Babeliales bacterium]
MKIFLDTANIADIKKWVATGLIDGVTTNPSHLSKEGGDPRLQVLEICSLLPDGEISIEVTEKDPEAVYKQAKIIAALAANVVVKIPCHADYYEVINRLVQEGVRLNITLVFSLLQGLMMCKLNVAMISPFVGRLEDIKVDGINLLEQLRYMVDFYGYETEILAASLRTVEHFHKAVAAGVDIVTIPVSVFEQAIQHPLTDQGMLKFDADWKKLGISQFP